MAANPLPLLLLRVTRCHAGRCSLWAGCPAAPVTPKSSAAEGRVAALVALRRRRRLEPAARAAVWTCLQTAPSQSSRALVTALPPQGAQRRGRQHLRASNAASAAAALACCSACRACRDLSSNRPHLAWTAALHRCPPPPQRPRPPRLCPPLQPATRLSPPPVRPPVLPLLVRRRPPPCRRRRPCRCTCTGMSWRHWWWLAAP